MTDQALKLAPGGRQSYLDFSVLARAYARYRVGRLERMDPVAVQSALMLRLLRQARGTRPAALRPVRAVSASSSGSGRGNRTR